MGTGNWRQYLVSSGVVDQKTLFEALNLQKTLTPSIGTIALEEDFLSVSEVLEILDLQEETKRLFGELAVDLGYLNESEIERLLELQNQRRPPIQEILGKMKKGDQTDLDMFFRKFNLC